MKQKLALCCALIHRPTVLFLDEPTTGVDAVSRKEFWEMLKRLKAQGITILVSTPYMDEAVLCERIALIQNGSILSINTPENIISQFPQRLYSVRSGQMSRLLADIRQFPETASCFSFGDAHHVTFSENKKLLNELMAFLKTKDYNDIEIKEIIPTIEDCFIDLMK
jgi:ABC-type multidrug transport system ATPase subunit